MTKRTGHLPGMKPKTVPAVHKAIEALVALRDELKALREKEAVAQSALLAAMKKAKLRSYSVDGRVATLDVKEKISARLDPEGAEEAQADVQ